MVEIGGIFFMKFVTQFNRSSLEKPKKFVKPSLTVQSLRDDLDINVIYEKYCSGEPLPTTSRELIYNGSIITESGFIDAQKLVEQVTDEFNKLPMDIKAEFGNNPVTYLSSLDECHNGNLETIDKFVDMKLLDSSFKSKFETPSVSVVDTSGSISSLNPRGDSQNLENPVNSTSD